ncbi:MAG: hypothetical protein V4507_03015 [Verrucomicrobiota bacterium]
MIPAPWVTYGVGAHFLNPLVAGFMMLFVIFGFNLVYRQKIILFQGAFALFAICKMMMFLFEVHSSLLLNTGWFSGVLLCGFVGLTLFLHRPFTIELIEEFFPRAMVKGFHFIRINQCISLAWGIHFGISAIISLLPYSSGIQVVLTLISMSIASCFTQKFPRWYRFHRFIPRHRAGKEAYQPFVEI